MPMTTLSQILTNTPADVDILDLSNVDPRSIDINQIKEFLRENQNISRLKMDNNILDEDANELVRFVISELNWDRKQLTLDKNSFISQQLAQLRGDFTSGSAAICEIYKDYLAAAGEMVGVLLKDFPEFLRIYDDSYKKIKYFKTNPEVAKRFYLWFVLNRHFIEKWYETAGKRYVQQREELRKDVIKGHLAYAFDSTDQKEFLDRLTRGERGSFENLSLVLFPTEIANAVYDNIQSSQQSTALEEVKNKAIQQTADIALKINNTFKQVLEELRQKESFKNHPYFSGEGWGDEAQSMPKGTEDRLSFDLIKSYLSAARNYGQSGSYSRTKEPAARRLYGDFIQYYFEPAIESALKSGSEENSLEKILEKIKTEPHTVSFQHHTNTEDETLSATCKEGTKDTSFILEEVLLSANQLGNDKHIKLILEFFRLLEINVLDNSVLGLSSKEAGKLKALKSSALKDRNSLSYYIVEAFEIISNKKDAVIALENAIQHIALPQDNFILASARLITTYHKFLSEKKYFYEESENRSYEEWIKHFSSPINSKECMEWIDVIKNLQHEQAAELENFYANDKNRQNKKVFSSGENEQHFAILSEIDFKKLTKEKKNSRVIYCLEYESAFLLDLSSFSFRDFNIEALRNFVIEHPHKTIVLKLNSALTQEEVSLIVSVLYEFENVSPIMRDDITPLERLEKKEAQLYEKIHELGRNLQYKAEIVYEISHSGISYQNTSALMSVVNDKSIPEDIDFSERDDENLPTEERKESNDKSDLNAAFILYSAYRLKTLHAKLSEIKSQILVADSTLELRKSLELLLEEIKKSEKSDIQSYNNFIYKAKNILPQSTSGKKIYNLIFGQKSLRDDFEEWLSKKPVSPNVRPAVIMAWFLQYHQLSSDALPKTKLSWNKLSDFYQETHHSTKIRNLIEFPISEELLEEFSLLVYLNELQIALERGFKNIDNPSVLFSQVANAEKFSVLKNKLSAFLQGNKEFLDLSDFKLTDVHVPVLKEIFSLLGARLKHINIRNNEFSFQETFSFTDGSQRLLHRHWINDDFPRLKIVDSRPYDEFLSENELNLSCKTLTDEDLPGLLDFLKNHPNITALDVSSNHFSDEKAMELARYVLGTLGLNREYFKYGSQHTYIEIAYSNFPKNASSASKAAAAITYIYKEYFSSQQNSLPESLSLFPINNNYQENIDFYQKNPVIAERLFRWFYMNRASVENWYAVRGRSYETPFEEITLDVLSDAIIALRELSSSERSGKTTRLIDKDDEPLQTVLGAPFFNPEQFYLAFKETGSLVSAHQECDKTIIKVYRNKLFDLASRVITLVNEKLAQENSSQTLNFTGVSTNLLKVDVAASFYSMYLSLNCSTIGITGSYEEKAAKWLYLNTNVDHLRKNLSSLIDTKNSVDEVLDELESNIVSYDEKALVDDLIYLQNGCFPDGFNFTAVDFSQEKKNQLNKIKKLKQELILLQNEAKDFQQINSVLYDEVKKNLWKSWNGIFNNLKEKFSNLSSAHIASVIDNFFQQQFIQSQIVEANRLVMNYEIKQNKNSSFKSTGNLEKTYEQFIQIRKIEDDKQALLDKIKNLQKRLTYLEITVKKSALVWDEINEIKKELDKNINLYNSDLSNANGSMQEILRNLELDVELHQKIMLPSQGITNVAAAIAYIHKDFLLENNFSIPKFNSYQEYIEFYRNFDNSQEANHLVEFYKTRQKHITVPSEEINHLRWAEVFVRTIHEGIPGFVALSAEEKQAKITEFFEKNHHLGYLLTPQKLFQIADSFSDLITKHASIPLATTIAMKDAARILKDSFTANLFEQLGITDEETKFHLLDLSFKSVGGLLTQDNSSLESKTVSLLRVFDDRVERVLKPNIQKEMSQENSLTESLDIIQEEGHILVSLPNILDSEVVRHASSETDEEKSDERAFLVYGPSEHYIKEILSADRNAVEEDVLTKAINGIDSQIKNLSKEGKDTSTLYSQLYEKTNQLQYMQFVDVLTDVKKNLKKDWLHSIWGLSYFSSSKQTETQLKDLIEKIEVNRLSVHTRNYINEAKVILRNTSSWRSFQKSLKSCEQRTKPDNVCYAAARLAFEYESFLARHNFFSFRKPEPLLHNLNKYIAYYSQLQNLDDALDIIQWFQRNSKAVEEWYEEKASRKEFLENQMDLSSSLFVKQGSETYEMLPDSSTLDLSVRLFNEFNIEGLKTFLDKQPVNSKVKTIRLHPSLNEMEVSILIDALKYNFDVITIDVNGNSTLTAKTKQSIQKLENRNKLLSNNEFKVNSIAEKAAMIAYVYKDYLQNKNVPHKNLQDNYAACLKFYSNPRNALEAKALYDYWEKNQKRIENWYSPGWINTRSYQDRLQTILDDSEKQRICSSLKINNQSKEPFFTRIWSSWFSTNSSQPMAVADPNSLSPSQVGGSYAVAGQGLGIPQERDLPSSFDTHALGGAKPPLHPPVLSSGSSLESAGSISSISFNQGGNGFSGSSLETLETRVSDYTAPSSPPPSGNADSTASIPLFDMGEMRDNKEPPLHSFSAANAFSGFSLGRSVSDDTVPPSPLPSGNAGSTSSVHSTGTDVLEEHIEAGKTRTGVPKPPVLSSSSVHFKTALKVVTDNDEVLERTRSMSNGQSI